MVKQVVGHRQELRADEFIGAHPAWNMSHTKMVNKLVMSVEVVKPKTDLFVKASGLV